MTAIPADDTRPMLLICDDCGRAFSAAAAPPPEWLVLWTFAVEAGWRGRDRPVGPHVCERCARPAAAGPPASARSANGDVRSE